VSLFLRLLEDDDKALALRTALRAVAAGEPDPRVFEADPDAFALVPGAPFAYWVTDQIRETFLTFPSVETHTVVTSGTGTLDDFRFLRLWWESTAENMWFPYAKGGAYAPYYFDHYLSVNWGHDGQEMKAWIVVSTLAIFA
jgi:hypothetical protein